MTHRIRPLIATLATIGAVAGGGAAIASAATSTSTSAASGTTTTHTSTAGTGTHSPAGHTTTGKRNCPNK